MSTPDKPSVAMSGQGVMHGIGGTQFNYFGSPPAGRLAEAAEDLARNVRRRWLAEEEHRRVSDPDPLPVRWTTAPGDPPGLLTDSCGNSPEVDVRDRLGLLAEVVRQMGAQRQTGPEKQADHRRLVVLGRPGSGKTILAIQLAMRLLAIRKPADPVPVIFTVGSWDPRASSLRDWLTGQLERDIPALAAPLTIGETVACGLVTEDRILPVLDGFDEIAPGLHGHALKSLNESLIPLVLTSRSEEYDTATEDRDLGKAVTIQLTDLTLAELGEYLPQTTSRLVEQPDGTTVNMWDFVLGELARDPDRPACASLAGVLGTPLMATLARTVYGAVPGPDPDDLLNGQYSSAVDLEEHLLSSFIPSIYPNEPDDGPFGLRWPWHRRWNADRAGRWLGYLAADMRQRGTLNLAWWELGTSMGRLPRALWVAFTAAPAFGLATGIGNIPVDLVGTSHGVAFALVRGVVVGALHGLVVGLAFGVLCWLALRGKELKPSPVRIRVFGGGSRTPAARPAGRVTIGVVGGLLVALSIELIDRNLVTRLGLNDGLGGGLIDMLGFVPEVGLAIGVTFGIMARIEAPIDVKEVASPLSLLRSNRANAIAYLLVGMLVPGVEFGIAIGATRGPLTGLAAGLVFGIEIALGAGPGYGMILIAWGQWVALARVWLPLTGRLPWPVAAFLDDAYRRGALRQTGAVYQFRHVRLQDYLANHRCAGRADAPSRIGRTSTPACCDEADKE